MKVRASYKVTYIVIESLFLAFCIGFFAPMEIFITNKDYFWFDIYHLFPIAVLVSITIFILSSILLIITYRFQFFDYVLWLVSSFSYALYIQGNFVLEDYGPLNGIEINWGDYKQEKYISWFVWAIVFILFGIISKKLKDERKYRLISALLGCTILLQIFTLSVVAIKNDIRRSSSQYIVTDQNLWDYSQNRNFIILLLDYYDSEAFDYILNNPEEVDYESMLDGFTFYRNTVGSYNCTDMAIPQIITGEGYVNTEVFGQYLRRAYKEADLLNNLDKEGYDINIYTTSILPEDKFAVELIDNYQVREKLSISSKKRFIELMYKLVGFRYTPQPVKKLFWFYPDEIDDLMEVNDLEYNAYSWDNFAFYNRVNDIKVNNKDNQFKFIHLKGAHVPHRLSREFKELDTDDLIDGGQGPEAMVEDGRGLFILVREFLNGLKENNVYDNSAIIIMSDHGGDYKYAYDWRRECPLFLVKGVAERHELVVNDNAFSYFDIQTVWKELMDGNEGMHMDIHTTSENRVFRQYWWEGDLNYMSYGSDIVEFETNSHAYDYDSLRENGVVYYSPQKEVEQ